MKKLALLFLMASLLLCVPVGKALAAIETYTVTNCATSGDGSMKQAILEANGHTNDVAGPDIIEFDIPTSEASSEGDVQWYKIRVPGGDYTWPSISDAVIIDGTTQPTTDAYNNPYGPEIEIDGYQSSSNQCGLKIYTSNCVVKDLVLNRFTSGNSHGIYIYGSNNRIYGCYIGTDVSGEVDRGNYGGVTMWSNANPVQFNIIGSTEASNRNIISGNTAGIYIGGDPNVSSNEVIGNYIGTDRTGTSPLGNSLVGVVVTDEAQYNKIGDGTDAGRNIISGNDDHGVVIGHSNTKYNQVLGNYIGTDYTGTADLGNSNDGVRIYDGAQYNLIGDGTSGGRNIISGNSGIFVAGVGIYDTNTNSNEVLGNYIGLAANGTDPISNYHGVYIRDGAQFNKIGSSEGENNVISGNSDSGVWISGTDTNSNEVLGNYIGMDANGTVDKGNGRYGIQISGGAQYNKIGNGTPDGRNIISGNDLHGVYILEFNTCYNQVLGNFIGTHVDGAQDRGNTWSGVRIDHNAQHNKIGDGTSGGRNIISGNDQYGVSIGGNLANLNQVLGNYIGTASNGATALYNSRDGVILHSDAQYNEIGSSEGEENVISGNAWCGVRISGTNTVFNAIIGNYIGTASNGATALGNWQSGVLITSEARYNTIGGSAAGEGNVISKNQDSGVQIGGTGTTSNEILGNYIGLAADGDTDLGNLDYGVHISDGAQYNEIGSSEGEKNIISGNDDYGVYISGANTDSNKVLGNYIGTNKDGTGEVKNKYHGVYIYDGPEYNRIGGSAADEGNVISGNGWSGVRIKNQARYNRVLGNIIGLKANGAEYLPNGGYLGNLEHGVYIDDDSDGNWIGDGTPGGRNIISGNTKSGIEIEDATTSYNKIFGNYIGTDVTGEVDLGNNENGVQIWDGPSYTLVGSNEGERNVISGNNHHGVLINEAGNNQVLGNYLGTDWTGTAPLGNSYEGVAIWATSGPTKPATINKIGNGSPGGRNIISGSQRNGIMIRGADASDNKIFGNFIGTDVTGAASLENQGSGVNIEEGAHHNWIGSSESGSGNVISGNAGGAININAGDSNKVLGNLIGTTSNGAAALGNGLTGVGIWSGAQYNQIGDGTPGSRNIISAAVYYGVGIGGDNTDHNQVLGNYIGTTSNGAVALGNGMSGVYIGDGAQYNRIGDGSSGGRNKICASEGAGIEIGGTDTNSNEVFGNYIGGVSEEGFGNAGDGVIIGWEASYNKIGDEGSAVPNIICGNGGNGVTIQSVNTNSNEVIGNYIGVRDEDGDEALGNAGDGVRIFDGASYNIIGTTFGARDQIISANSGSGISIDGTFTNYCEYNQILKNEIGVDKDRDPNNPLGNLEEGVSIVYSRYTQVGNGANDGRNVICASGGSGIEMEDSTTIEVKGNVIGTIPDGPMTYENNPFANSSNGISICDNCSFITIGGLNEEEENFIQGNYETGINIENSENVQVLGNYIIGNRQAGIILGESQNNQIGPENKIVVNGWGGIMIFNNSLDNLIGPGNYILANGTEEALADFYATMQWAFGPDVSFEPSGILVANVGAARNTKGNTITQNYIYENPGLGILLFNEGNEEIAAPTIVSITFAGGSATLTGNAIAGSTVEVFQVSGSDPLGWIGSVYPDPSGSGEGLTCEGTTIAQGDGSWSIFLPSLAPESTLSATATDTSGNTSMFSVNKVAYLDIEGPLIFVDVPYDGLPWSGGKVQTIECRVWDDTPIAAFNIYHSTDGGTTYPDTPNVATNESITPTDTIYYKYAWNVPYLNATNSKIRVTASDEANNYGTRESEWFMITTVPPSISISRPAAGDSLKGGEQDYPVTYVATSEVGFLPMTVRYSTNESVGWESMTTSEDGDGVYSWDVPAVDSSDCYISIEAEEKGTGMVARALSGKFAIDSTRPQVLESKPLDGATNVARDTVIKVVFSEEMDQSSVYGAFHLEREEDGVEIETGNFTWEDSRILTFAPEADLRGGEKVYTLSVEALAKDPAGNALDPPYSASFTTTADVGNDQEAPGIRIMVNGTDIQSGENIASPMTIEAIVTDNYQLDLNASQAGVRMFWVGKEVAPTLIISSITKVHAKYDVTEGLEKEKDYSIKVEATDAAGNVSIEVVTDLVVDPGRVKSSSVISYPGTFSPKKGEVATLAYMLSKHVDTTIYLYSPSGKIVWTRKFSAGSMGGKAGYNAITFDGKSDITGTTIANGIYVGKLIGEGRQIGKLYIVVYD